MNDQENNNSINTGDFKFQDFVPPTGKLLENEAEANNPDVTENVSQEAAIETTASQETSQEIQVATERLISDQEPQAVVQELSEEATPQCKTEDSIDSQETKVEVQVAEQAMEATPQLEIQKEKQSEQQILENAKNVETDIVTSDTFTPLEEAPHQDAAEPPNLSATIDAESVKEISLSNEPQPSLPLEDPERPKIYLSNGYETDETGNFQVMSGWEDPTKDTITVNQVCKTYKGRCVVNHVSVKIKKGEIVGLLGPNGAGKTTTFYMVVGLVKPDEGKVMYNDVEITQKAMYQRSRMGVGYLPQEASVFRKLTVRENIWLILEGLDISQKERKERLDMLLTDLDIGRISESLGYALSGGERRRVEIARCLAAQPSFILLDEPFAGVDPIAVHDIQSIVLRLQREKGLGILITDHNVSETLAIVDRAYILSSGKILVSGTAQFVAQNETARKFYLGDRFKLDQIEKPAN